MGAVAASAASTSAAAEVSQSETVVVHGAKSCVTVDADGSRTLAYDCLTAGLQASAEEQGPGQVPTLDAKALTGRGNPEALGTISFTASQIRMGKNFGKSVYPERPPQPSFSHPIFPGGKP